jgi:hypothetical protein
VVHLPVEQQCRHGFYAGGFSFCNPVTFQTKMNYFCGYCIAVDQVYEILLGTNTNRTTGMIKDRFFS